MAITEKVEYVLNMRGNLVSGLDNTTTSLKEVDAAAKRTAKTTKSQLATGLKAGTAAAGALSAAMLAAGAAVGSFFDAVADRVDETQTLAANTGLAAETIAGLRVAARATNKDLTELVPKKLPRQLATAARGGKDALDAFDMLGVAAFDANGSMRDADTIFREVIDSLTRMDNETERAALATQLLGKQGQALLSAFGDSSELDRFVEQAEKFSIDVAPGAVSGASAWFEAQSNLTLALESTGMALVEAVGGWEQISKWVDDFALGLMFTSRVVIGFADTVVQQMKDVKAVFSGELGIGEYFSKGMGRMGGLTDIFNEAAIEAFDFFQSTRDMTAGMQGPPLSGAGPATPSGQYSPRTTGGGGGAGPTGPSAAVIPGAVVTGADGVTNVSRVPTVKVSEIEQPVQLPSTFSNGLGLAADGIAGLSSGLMALIGPIAAVPAALEGLNSTLESLPDLVTSLPGTLTTLLENLDTIPMEIIEGLAENLPDILLAWAKAAIKIFLLPFDVLGKLIIAGFEALLPKFAESLADALAAFFDKANPFGEGKILETNLSASKGDKKLLGISLPSFDTGGEVTRSGLAFVDRGDLLQGPRDMRGRDGTAGSSGGASSGMSVGSITVVAQDTRSLADALRRELGPYGLNLDADAILGG